MIKFRLKDVPGISRHQFFNTEEVLPVKEAIYDVFGEKASITNAMSLTFTDEPERVNFLIMKYPQYFEIVND